MFNLILKGKDELKISTNKIYNVLVVTNSKQEDYMNEIYDKFLLDINITYMGIDFEFNKVAKTNKEVALMQICLYNNDINVYIFIIDPNNISNKDKLIKLLIKNNIYKILHGAESLDAEYIFSELLIDNKNIDLFCESYYDTKYLCDYYNAYNNIKESCSIYDLLLNHGIITKDKYNELYKIEEDMGPIWLIKKDVNNLSDILLKYCLYDALYLPELIIKLLSYGDMYKYTIPQLGGLVNKYKKDINNKFNELKKDMDIMNIYYIYYNNERYLLNDIWILYHTIMNSYDNEINLLNNVNYFKNSIKILSKLFIYLAISKKFKIYKTKNMIFNKNIIRDYYEWIKSYPHIYKLFVYYYKDIYNDIINWE